MLRSVVKSAFLVGLTISPAMFGPTLAADAKQDREAVSLWSRSKLLDSSERQELGERGVSVNGWLTQTYQSIMEGDGPHAGQYGGKATVTGTFDGGKLGLWEGLSANVIFEQIYGDDANSFGNGLLPANGIMAFPRVGGYDHDLSLIVSQRFNENFDLSVGKFNLLHLVAKTPLVGGGGEETFINPGLAGPITGVVPPYLLGAVANIHTDLIDYTIMVYDPRSAQDLDVVEHPFEEGVTFLASATMPTQINGLPGYYGVRGIYSTAEGLDLSRIPEIAELPPEAEGTLTRKGKWYVNVAVQQYLYENPDQPGNGWGLFAYAAIADGNPNVFRWTAFGGLAGNSFLPGREMDKWGIGYFRYGLSDDLKDGLDELDIQIQDEQGIEAFYNFFVTPWFQVTGDIQWIDSFKPGVSDDLIGMVRVRSVF